MPKMDEERLDELCLGAGLEVEGKMIRIKLNLFIFISIVLFGFIVYYSLSKQLLSTLRLFMEQISALNCSFKFQLVSMELDCFTIKGFLCLFQFSLFK